MKLDKCFKNIKNIQFNSYIFKIYSHVNFFSESYSLQSSFGPFNNILGLYKQKEKSKKNFI